MNDVQYEELCRYFISKMTGLPISKIESIRIPNPKRGDLPKYKHQIDLYWETSDDICLYLNIANAKWRSTEKVNQEDILLLQQVKQEVAAHKAVMITNSEFTSGAKAAAMNHGVGLHIVRPAIDTSVFDVKNRALIQSKIQELASSASQPVFNYTVIYKAFDLATPGTPASAPRQSSSVSYSTKVVIKGANRAVNGCSDRSGSTSGPANKPGGGGFKTK